MHLHHLFSVGISLTPQRGQTEACYKHCSHHQHRSRSPFQSFDWTVDYHTYKDIQMTVRKILWYYQTVYDTRINMLTGLLQKVLRCLCASLKQSSQIYHDLHPYRLYFYAYFLSYSRDVTVAHVPCAFQRAIFRVVPEQLAPPLILLLVAISTKRMHKIR